MFNFQPITAKSNTLIVPDEYFSIQEAINHSKYGDTIFVKSEIYFENLIINKNGLGIVGENRDATIIDGSGIGITMYVEANNTVLNNFTLQNSGHIFTDS